MAILRRGAALAALALGASALGAGLASAPGAAQTASAGQVYRVPPNGVFLLRGHGWGHGHGMSQYGAYGAAKIRGLTYRQILSFYYPGTTLTGIPLDRDIRVLLHGTTGGRLVVAPHGAAKLTASTTVDGVADCVLPDSLDDGATAVAQWRARVVSTPDGTRLRLQASPDGDTWSPAKPPDCDPAWSKPLDGSITFDGGNITNLVRSSGIAPYRGALRAAFTGSRIFVVNVAPIDDYLRSVVPSEMPSSWSPAALQAQAVAARSYASYELAHPKNKPYYDVYDDTRDQMYLGREHEAGSTNAAVKATEDADAGTGAILRDSDGRAAFTQFSSSDGGWTASGGQPYLPAQKDPYDGLVPSSVHSWTSTLSAATISRAYSARIGRLQALVVASRDGHGAWGGRITSLVLRGSEGSETLSGLEFRYAFGLRSEWFRVVEPPQPPTEVTATVSAGVATVGWQPPPRDGDAAVTGFRVTVEPGGLTARTDATARTVDISGIAPEQAQTVRVVALSRAGRGWPATVTTKVHRITGGDRVATAVATSQATFGDGRAGAVVLTRRGGASGSGLAAPVLAAAVRAPVLLTARAAVPPATTAEIKRVLPAGGTVYLLGSTAVVSDDVRTSLRELGYKVRRRGGETPAATARAVARSVEAAHPVKRVLEVDVSDAEAAWVAGVAAARRHGVVLLTTGGALAPETAAWLAHHSGLPRFAVGSAAAAADAQARPLAGDGASGTAVAVAAKFFAKPARLAVTSPASVVAGLAAASRLAVTGGVLLYAEASSLSADAAGYVRAHRSTLRRVELVGARLPYDDVESDTQNALLGR